MLASATVLNNASWMRHQLWVGVGEHLYTHSGMSPLRDIGLPRHLENSPAAVKLLITPLPTGVYTRFIQLYGGSLWVLWKLVLLRKRVIIYGGDRVGPLCQDVYAACTLGVHSTPMAAALHSVPLFYVNLADSDRLRHMEVNVFTK